AGGYRRMGEADRPFPERRGAQDRCPPEARAGLYGSHAANYGIPHPGGNPEKVQDRVSFRDGANGDGRGSARAGPGFAETRYQLRSVPPADRSHGGAASRADGRRGRAACTDLPGAERAGEPTLPLFYRQPDDERGADAFLGLEAYLPLMFVYHDGMSDGQPLARASAYLLGGEEGVEYFGFDRFRDTAARILYPHLRP